MDAVLHSCRSSGACGACLQQPWHRPCHSGGRPWGPQDPHGLQRCYAWWEQAQVRRPSSSGGGGGGEGQFVRAKTHSCTARAGGRRWPCS